MPIDYDQLPDFAGFDGHQAPDVWHGIENQNPFTFTTLPLEVIEHVTDTGQRIIRGITGGAAYAGYIAMQKRYGRLLFPEGQ